MPVREPYEDRHGQPGPLPSEEKPKAPEPKKYTQLDDKDLKSWWDKIRESETKRDTELVKSYNEAIDYYNSKHFLVLRFSFS